MTNECKTFKIEKQLKVTRQPQGKGYVSGFKIAGDYIEKLGFKEGDFVDVVAENDLIIIRKQTGTARLNEMIKKNPILLTLIRSFSLIEDE